MRSLWLAATLALGVALGGWSLPQAQAEHGRGSGHNHGHSQHGHHGNHGHHGGHGHHGHDCHYGHGHHGHGHYGHYGSGYGNVYYGGYAPYYGGLPGGIGIYSSGYRGLGYSNLRVGPSLGVGIGGMYGAPFGGFRF